MTIFSEMLCPLPLGYTHANCISCSYTGLEIGNNNICDLYDYVIVCYLQSKCIFCHTLLCYSCLETENTAVRIVLLTKRHPLSAKVALTSTKSGGCSVGIVGSRTWATEFSFVWFKQKMQATYPRALLTYFVLPDRALELLLYVLQDKLLIQFNST
jgi:hypothetical protein